MKMTMAMERRAAGNRHKTKHNQSLVEVEVLEEDDDTSLELDGFT